MADGAWVTLLVGRGGSTVQDFFAYTVQARLPLLQDARLKLCTNGVRVFATAAMPRATFAVLEQNESGFAQPALLDGGTVRLPVGETLPYAEADAADAAGSMAARTAYWSMLRLLEQLQEWQSETEMKIARIDAALRSMNKLAV